MHLPGLQQCCESVTLRNPLSFSRGKNKIVSRFTAFLPFTGAGDKAPFASEEAPACSAGTGI